MVVREIPIAVLGLIVCLYSSHCAGAADEELDKAIAHHRMGTVTIQTDPGAEVRVQQLRHEFWFGAALSSSMFSSRTYYEKRLGPQITKQMAGWVKESDPQAVLYLNDYDILTGNQLEAFVAHVQVMLDRGVSFDGLGVQGHVHRESFEPKALKNSLDALAKFDLPIRITEFNLPGQRSPYMKDRRRQMTPAQEDAKAKGIVDYYTICFAHPAVDGILMWGFWEGANWIPASSLYKRDWTPTPAAQAYHDLVYKQWWTDWSGKADAEGKCTRTSCDRGKSRKNRPA